MPYNWQSMSFLNAIGYNMSAPISRFNTRFGKITKDVGPSYMLDPDSSGTISGWWRVANGGPPPTSA